MTVSTKQMTNEFHNAESWSVNVIINVVLGKYIYVYSSTSSNINASKYHFLSTQVFVATNGLTGLFLSQNILKVNLFTYKKSWKYKMSDLRIIRLKTRVTVLYSLKMFYGLFHTKNRLHSYILKYCIYMF